MPVAAENMVRKRFMLQLLQVDWLRVAAKFLLARQW